MFILNLQGCKIKTMNCYDDFVNELERGEFLQPISPPISHFRMKKEKDINDIYDIYESKYKDFNEKFIITDEHLIDLKPFKLNDIDNNSINNNNTYDRPTYLSICDSNYIVLVIKASNHPTSS